MSTFREDIKIGTMMPLIKGDDISEKSIGWEHLSPALQSIVAKPQREDIRLEDLGLSMDEVRKVMSGERASQLRVIGNVHDTVCVMGTLEMYSMSDGSGILQILHTEFTTDKNGDFIPSGDGVQNTYIRRYILRHRAWSAWNSDKIPNNAIDEIVRNVYKQI